MPKEAFLEASSGSLPVSAKETEAMRATGAPGNCCPLLSRCHPSGSLCVSRLFPRCPLLHLTSAAKAESVLGLRHLDHVPQMMETGLLIERTSRGGCIPESLEAQGPRAAQSGIPPVS